MSSEGNESIAHRYFEALSSQGDVDAADEFIAPDYVGHIPPYPDIQGLEGFKQFATQTLTIYPDAEYTIEDVVAATEDRVVTRWTFRGTYQSQSEMDWVSSGEQVTMTGVTILRTLNGKVVETWTSFDLLSTMQRLGPLPELMGITEQRGEIRLYSGDVELPFPPMRISSGWRWPPRW